MFLSKIKEMTRFEAKIHKQFGEVIDNSTLHKYKHPTSLMKLLYKLRKLQSLAKDYRSSSRIRALSKSKFSPK